MDINFLLVLENILKDIYHNLYETDKLIEKLSHSILKLALLIQKLFNAKRVYLFYHWIL